MAAASLILQLVVEGYRWQLGLAYLVCVGSLLAPRLSSRTRWPHAITVVLASFGSLGLIVSVLFGVGFPMFDLPRPTGPYAVGVTNLYVADVDREETFTSNPDDYRELMVRIWYPASEPDAPRSPVPYWDDVDTAGPDMARLVREILGVAIRDNAFDHYTRIPTHSYASAELIAKPEKLPVLVFSHGYGMADPTSNTALMEELASRGYWVASIAHTYETPTVLFEDGRAVSWSAEAVGQLLGGQDESFFESYVEIEAPAERDALVRAYLAKQSATSTSMKVWNADTHTVVDEIERIASGERDTAFAGRLDLDRLGVAGMSFGGATAGVFCVEDSRCKAGLNLDGFHYGDGMADAVIQVPFMILAAKHAGIPINDFFYRHAAGPAYIAIVDGSTHMNFTDSSISSVAFRWLGGLGDIDGHRMLRVVNAYVLTFFDHYLLGRPSVLLKGDSPDYPEVELLSRNSGG